MIAGFLGLSPLWLWGALGAVLLLAGLMFVLSAGRLSRRAWAGIGAALMCIALLLVFRSALGAARQLGVEACENAQRKAAEKQRAADQSRTDAADAAGGRAQSGITAVERHYVEKVREVYRDRPAGPCLDADGLRRIREADAAYARAATGDGPRALLPPELAEDQAGPGGS